MTAPLVFLDCETTGLALTDQIWEFAAIRRDPDGIETELHLFVDHDRSRCERLPDSFRDDHNSRYRDHEAVTRAQACLAIQKLFGSSGPKPHVVGAVPNFDTERIGMMFAEQRYEMPFWHYHLIDVENLAVGFIRGLLSESRARSTGAFLPNPNYAKAIALPWDSDALSAAVGVDPDQFERHTAMGDVRWAMAIYDAVISGGVS